MEFKQSVAEYKSWAVYGDMDREAVLELSQEKEVGNLSESCQKKRLEVKLEAAVDSIS